MPRKVRQYISLVVLCLFIAGVVLVILAHFLVTPERMRSTLVPVFEKYLHCKINLSEVAVSPLSGVTLTNLELLGSEDRRLLLAVDKVVLRYQLLPLLQQRIVIDEIRLDNPRINVECFADGTLNVAELLSQNNINNNGSAKNNSNKTTSNDVDITISKLYVNQGELLFRDYRFATAPHRYNLTELDININGFSLYRDFSIKLWGKLNGAPVDIDGVMNLAQKSYDIKFNVEQLDMVQFQPYYRQTFSGNISSLQLNIDSRIWGSAGAQLNTKGTAHLRQLDFQFSSTSRSALHIGDLGIDYTLKFDSKSGDLSIVALNVNCDGIVAELDGDINVSEKKPNIALNVSLNQWDLRAVVGLLPSTLHRYVDGYGIAGNVDAQMVLKGDDLTFNQLFHDATISLDAIQCSVGTMRPAVSGIINLNGHELVAKNLTVVLGDNTVNCQLKCQDWLAKRPDFRLQIQADEFNSNGLAHQNNQQLHRPIAGSSANHTSSASFQALSEPNAINLPFDIGGDLIINKGVFNTYVASGIRAHYEIKDSQLEYERVAGQFSEGSFTAQGQIDLTRQGFVYAGHVALQKINLTTLMPQVDPAYADFLSGTMDAEVKYSGAGTQRLRMQQNMEATGSFNIANGHMQSIAVLNSLASVLQNPELQVFSFEQGNGDFTLKTGGHLQYSAQFLGSRAKFMPTGTWTIDGTINADVDVFLAPALLAKLDRDAQICRYLKNDQGWGFIPLQVAGTVGVPVVKVNLVKVKKNIVWRGTEKLLKKIDKSHDSGAVDPALDTSIQLIESAFNGLLGK